MSGGAPLTLGTAGHIDHGKTALVGALTGTDTDRLPEERARGISIELGYAQLELPSGRRLSVVDVPGHERFVRTMVAGASGIDLLLLVVACDDGVMPQTREHLAICDLLGVAHAVVALTKRDAVDDETAALAAEDVAELLDGTRYAGSPVVETSVRDGRGLDALRRELDAAASRVQPRSAAGPVRLWVDRAFSLHGIGTVVTGTLWSGEIAGGDRLAAEPGGAVVRVRSVEVHGRPVERAGAGQRVAVGLVGVERSAVERGTVLAPAGASPRSFRLDVRLEALPVGPGVRQGAAVQVLLGTSDHAARVRLLDAGALAAGGSALAQLRLAERVSARRGDRLVIRLSGPPLTVAGAVVIDPAPRRHGDSEAVRARLALLERGEPEAIVMAGLAEHAGPAALADLAPPGMLAAEQALAALEALVGRDLALELPGDVPTWLSRDAYEALARRAAELLDERAAREPLAPGLPLEAVAADGPGRDALLAALAADGVLVREGPLVRAPGARAEAGTVHAEAAAELLGALERGGATPPDLPTLREATGLDQREYAALVAALEREARIVRFGDDLAYPAERFAQARATVERICAEHGSLALADLRDALGTSRRVAQALLERLDADGVTRRIGDERVLRRRGRAAGGP